MMYTISEINETRFARILKDLESCKRISNQLDQLDTLTNSINDDNISKLIKSSSRLSNETQSSILRGSDYRRLLCHLQPLESIVQLVPDLTKCINDESRFVQATNLLDHITNLNEKYGAQLPIIDNIYRKSEELKAKLVSNLSADLDRIAGSSNNEGVSHIIQRLFRCGNFTDRDLKLKYLQARDNWFNDTCEDSGASFDDVVRIHCEGLPSIYREYRTIFCRENSSIDGEDDRFKYKNPLGEDGAIINSWLLMKTSIFISSLEVYLRCIHQCGNQTPTMLADTMKRCFELSNWLASIGFDFSTRLRPLFLQAIGVEVKASIERTTETFETNFTATVSKSIESLLLPIEDELLRISNLRHEEKLPESIEHYPVFRIYCLHILNSLRWLQISKGYLSPVSLCLDTYEVLNASFTRVTKALATILNLDSNSRHPILTKIAISYITEVLPFMSRYCEVLFPEKVVLSIIGLSKADFKKLSITEREKLSDIYLNHKQIAEPLKSTMPTLLQTIK